MISADSKKPSSLETYLASLLHGLYHRGLAVGVDDAARLERLFQHAEGWSHQRRVRALKMLLARSDEERRLLDQLAPFLFVDAEKRDDDVPEPRRQVAEPLLPESQFFTEDAPRRKGDPPSGDEPVQGQPQTPRKRKHRKWSIAAIVVMFGLAAAGLWISPWSYRPEDPPPPAFPPPPPALPPPSETDPILLPPSATDPDKVEVGKHPPPPWWPFALVFWSAAAPVWIVSTRWIRARRQARNIRAIASSAGARSYRLILPPERRIPPLDADAVREATFHLSAPTAEATATWLDVHRTVQDTTRNAGLLSLHWDVWREHRQVLFIEDVAPSMACWPGFGHQMVESILRQGNDLIWYFMKGSPESLYRDRDLSDCVSLEQVLAGMNGPTVVVLSDAAAMNSQAARGRASWLGLLSRAVWLHPAGVETWGPGARWLAEHLRIAPMTSEGLLRLSAPGQGNSSMRLEHWRPLQLLGKSVEARIAYLHSTLGEPVFWWLSAGAVLDRVGLLTTSLWWTLRNEGIVAAPQEHLGRIWELNEVRVDADGTVKFAAELREALLEKLRREHPKMLSTVVKWVERLVEADLKRFDANSLAAVEARAALARILLIDPRRRRNARRLLRKLAGDGFGNWADAAESSDEVQNRGRVRLARTPLPRLGSLACAAVCVVLLGLSLGFLGSVEWREIFFPPKPDFRFLGGSITPDKPLRFYDFYQLRADVWVEVENVRKQARREPGFPVVWSLDWDMIGPSKGESVNIDLGYGDSPSQGSWVISLYEVNAIDLQAPQRVDATGIVNLAWSVNTSNPPTDWRILRDEVVISIPQSDGGSSFFSRMLLRMLSHSGN